MTPENKLKLAVIRIRNAEPSRVDTESLKKIRSLHKRVLKDLEVLKCITHPVHAKAFDDAWTCAKLDSMIIEEEVRGRRFKGEY